MKFISRLTVITTVLIALLCPSVKGQLATIRGLIVDKEDNAPLIGASVLLMQIDEFREGVKTDLDGNYQFQVVPGSYKIVIRMYSYKPDTFFVDAKADEVFFQKTELEIAAGELDEVVIVAEGNQASINEGLRRKITSINAIEVVSSELFVRMGANTAADVLKMAPAVSITEGKYVNVRGLSDRYNRTLINMGEIPPLDPDRATVQMDRFPSSLIDNITVYKNFTPDLPGAFSAGLVDIQTKSHPSQQTISFSGSWSYNTVSSLRSDFLSYQGGQFDWLGFDDGTRAEPERFRDFGEFYTMQRRNSGLNQNYAFSYGDQKQLFGKPFGYIINLTYRRRFQDFADYQLGRYNVMTNFMGEIATVDADLADASGERTEIENLAGAIVNLSYKPSPYQKIQFTYMRNQGSTTGAREQVGLNQEDTENLRVNNVMTFTQQSLDAFQLRGKHTLEKIDMNWVGTYSLSNTAQPDFRILPYDIIIDRNLITRRDTVGYDSVFMYYIVKDTSFRIVDTTNQRQITAGSTQDFGRIFRSLTQRTFDLKFNATVPLNVWADDKRKWEIKFGGAYTFKDRTFDETNYRLVLTNGSPDVTDETGGYYESTVNAFFDKYPDATYESLGKPPGIPYDAFQEIYAGYLMTELNPIRTLNVVGGVRYEVTDMFIDGNGTSIGIDNGFNTFDWLPAFHLIYKPLPKMNIRTGYARTIARPSFREMSLFVGPNFSGDFRISGSPFLTRSVIDNFDFRFEWQPTRGEILSVGGFYKEILAPIELVYQGPSGEGARIAYENLRTSPNIEPIKPIFPKEVNDALSDSLGQLSVALAYGIEFEIRKNFGFIGKGWEKLEFWGNYALLRTEVPLDTRLQLAFEQTFGDALDEIPTRRRIYGQPTNTFNAELAFVDRENTGLDLSVSYNLFGDRLVLVGGNGVNIYERSRGLLNVSVRKQFGGHISVRFRATNLLDPAYQQVYRVIGTNEELEIFESSRRGRNFNLGFTYEF